MANIDPLLAGASCPTAPIVTGGALNWIKLGPWDPGGRVQFKPEQSALEVSERPILSPANIIDGNEEGERRRRRRQMLCARA